jgi:hypothetical protein
MKNYAKEYLDSQALIKLQNKQITRLKESVKLNQQIRNWTIILSVLIITLIVIL